MKRPINIEDHLREKMPPLRNQFRTELRAQLFEKAEQQFKRSSSFISFFTFLLNHMKKHSLGYISLVLVAALGINSIFKNPLSPEEVLANTMENYEPTGDIYHQKIAYYSYENDQLINSHIQENYNDEIGNSLSFTKDIETEEINSTYLYTVDKFGDIMVYEDSATEENLISTGKLETIYGKEWLDRFKGEKIYCLKSQPLENDQAAKSFLTLAADDYNTYLINTFIQDTFANNEKDHPYSYESMDSDKLLDLENLKKEKIITKDYIDQLINNESYEFSKIQDGGKDYYLFKMEGGQIWFYIDAGTYELAKFEYHYDSDPEAFDKYIVLESEFLDSVDQSHLFDPQQYPMLDAWPQLADHAPEYDYPEDGCYDWQMNKLDDSIYEKIPSVVVSEWQNELKHLSEPIQEQSIEASGIPPELLNSAQLPTKAPLTQGYHIAHYGWDFAPEEGQDDNIYSPRDGVVEKIFTDDWNGGYGNYLLMSHQINGKKIITLYAHLDKIDLKVGQELKEGEVIGIMGSTGRVTGKSLHFEVLSNGKQIDPALLWQDIKK